MLPDLPVYAVHRLQSLLNAAVQLMYQLRRSDHISDALLPLAARPGARSVQNCCSNTHAHTHALFIAKMLHEYTNTTIEYWIQRITFAAETNAANTHTA